MAHTNLGALLVGLDSFTCLQPWPGWAAGAVLDVISSYPGHEGVPSRVSCII
jgi:hypothetical protein